MRGAGCGVWGVWCMGEESLRAARIPNDVLMALGRFVRYSEYRKGQGSLAHAFPLVGGWDEPVSFLSRNVSDRNPLFLAVIYKMREVADELCLLAHGLVMLSVRAWLRCGIVFARPRFGA